MSSSPLINLVVVFMDRMIQLTIFYIFSPIFSTGLVRLYIAGLPLTSCQDYWATFLWRGSPNVCFFVSGSSRIRTHILVIRYPILTPLQSLLGTFLNGSVFTMISEDKTNSLLII